MPKLPILLNAHILLFFCVILYVFDEEHIAIAWRSISKVCFISKMKNYTENLGERHASKDKNLKSEEFIYLWTCGHWEWDIDFS